MPRQQYGDWIYFIVDFVQLSTDTQKQFFFLLKSFYLTPGKLRKILFMDLRAALQEICFVGCFVGSIEKLNATIFKK